MTALFPVEPPPKVGPVASFNLELFRKLIYGKGMPVLWEQAGHCPCRRFEETTHAAPDCLVCKGTGWEYHSAQEVWLQATQLEKDPRLFLEFGEWAQGTGRFTLQPEHLLGIRDRITLTKCVMVHQELLRRTEGAVQALRHPIADYTVNLVDGLTTFRVTHLRAGTAEGGAGAVLAEGVGFDVTGDGRIDWTKGDTAGTAPPVGAFFGVRYFAHPRFIINNWPFVVRDTRLHQKTDEEDGVHAPMTVLAVGRLDFEDQAVSS